MDLATLRKQQKSIEADLRVVFEKYGLTLKGVGGRVGSGTVDLKVALVDADLRDKDGNPTTPEAEEFKQWAQVFGMKPEWLGTTVRLGGREFKVAGLRKGRSRKNVLIESNGKTFVCPPEDVIKSKTFDEIRKAGK